MMVYKKGTLNYLPIKSINLSEQKLIPSGSKPQLFRINLHNYENHYSERRNRTSSSCAF